MEVYKRDENGNPEKWRSTVYFTDSEIVNQVEDYAEQHNVSESTAIVELMRNGQQALEANE